MNHDTEKEYSDVSNVEVQRNFVIPEELPEGAYGAPRGKNSPVENKSTAWKKDQRSYSAFNYEFKSLHDNPRKAEGSHPPHDNPDGKNDAPFEDA
ncbi:MAG TPA: cytosolic protein [Bacillaceae bacterium]|nr:cytosolic protein [Paenibacillus bovis]HLU20945.1 cytosolic protein [Bacillaceae bacterium]